MVGIVNVADLKNPTTGLTWRQENLNLTHQIPLGTLVEVNIEESDYHGLRAFVVRHDRDCDGTPLYALSVEPLDKYINTIRLIKAVGIHDSVERFMVKGGFDEESLIVIRSPK